MIFSVIVYAASSADSIKTLNTSSPPSNQSTNTQIGINVSRTDAEYLSELQNINNKINANRMLLSEQHKIAWEKRNINNYKSIVLDGIVICDKSDQRLNMLKNSDYFKPLGDITRNLVSNSKNAYTNYLNYTNNRNPSSIEIGNKYTNIINQSKDEFIITFEQLLKNGNYNYSSENGKITYFINK
ncbi:hypothetical protein DP73_18490 [Desulfosporosinus sp. HMP52]|uniref:hypothetical protein n=1 Tax=Desulfosporosinus sp. HMP52 TaxID=1487923 RepID=UPI00051F92F7|nr:hypothetical protein [Desulfosporosinus sp. HMP52]KGK85492.1 hypothetical protein DP73_18490 [Desulfosporosinus sp. HMP52]